jgi:hypothetical protein
VRLKPEAGDPDLVDLRSSSEVAIETSDQMLNRPSAGGRSRGTRPRSDADAGITAGTSRALTPRPCPRRRPGRRDRIRRRRGLRAGFRYGDDAIVPTWLHVPGCRAGADAYGIDELYTQTRSGWLRTAVREWARARVWQP